MGHAFVLAFLDHIWSEYYSEGEKRWIHADPCEARRDAAHLYEGATDGNTRARHKRERAFANRRWCGCQGLTFLRCPFRALFSGGWGKKLTYIISASKDEVVDVTRRYSKRYSEVLERRTLCPEAWLAIYCQSLSQMKCMMLPPARQAELTARRAVEEAEFAANETEEKENKRRAAVAAEEAKANEGRASAAAAAASASAAATDAAACAGLKEEEHQGRTTGSVEWRRARGELGADAVAVSRALNPDQCAAPSASSSAAAAGDGKTAQAKALCSTSETNAEDIANLTLTDSTAPIPSAAAASTVTPAAAAAVASSAAAAAAPPATRVVAWVQAGSVALVPTLQRPPSAQGWSSYTNVKMDILPGFPDIIMHSN